MSFVSKFRMEGSEVCLVSDFLSRISIVLKQSHSHAVLGVGNRSMDSLTAAICPRTIVATLKRRRNYASNKFLTQLYTQPQSRLQKSSASLSDHDGGMESGERNRTRNRTKEKIESPLSMDNAKIQAQKHKRKQNPVGIIEKEPWLKPFEGALRDRYKRLKDLRDKIEEEDESLLEFARA